MSPRFQVIAFVRFSENLTSDLEVIDLVSFNATCGAVLQLVDSHHLTILHEPLTADMKFWCERNITALEKATSPGLLDNNVL